jgi:UDP-N-acetyl-2-amino-2-deoxyglucuronate dehydrogenase
VLVKNFALTGAAGFIAPRHLRAIAETGNRLVAAFDPHDAVGVLDDYWFDVPFFTEFERFDRHLEKLRRARSGRVDYISVCSPNYLHDAHIRLALRLGAHAVVEKPLVVNPWNLDALQELERESGARVYTVLQLRLHPEVLALRQQLASATHRHHVTLTYVVPRGRWYDVSWKGQEERSGGILANIGIHFFDLLLWLFGACEQSMVTIRERRRATGRLELQRASVDWFLSTDIQDLETVQAPAGARSCRVLSVDEQKAEFSEGFSDLHTRVYHELLGGRGFGIDDARPSIELVHRLRYCPVSAAAVAEAGLDGR